MVDVFCDTTVSSATDDLCRRRTPASVVVRAVSFPLSLGYVARLYLDLWIILRPYLWLSLWGCLWHHLLGAQQTAFWCDLRTGVGHCWRIERGISLWLGFQAARDHSARRDRCLVLDIGQKRVTGRSTGRAGLRPGRGTGRLGGRWTNRRHGGRMRCGRDYGAVRGTGRRFITKANARKARSVSQRGHLALWKTRYGRGPLANPAGWDDCWLDRRAARSID